MINKQVDNKYLDISLKYDFNFFNANLILLSIVKQLMELTQEQIQQAPSKMSEIRCKIKFKKI